MTPTFRLTVRARHQLSEIDRLLEHAYGTPESLLGNQADPLDEAIYIILSFQTDLPRLKQTWLALRAAFPNWESLQATSLSAVEHALHSGGLHRQKARTIRRLLRTVQKKVGRLSLDPLREMADAEAEKFLTRLPGLSWKGARCVLLYSLDREVLPVDANTFRILKRAGLLRADAIYRRRSLHDALQSAVPAPRRRALHVNLVIHGQRICRPVGPQCPRCPARPACAMKGVIRRPARAAFPAAPPQSHQ
jgi:endonuclease III